MESLIKQVAAINPEAAEYLSNGVEQLPSFVDAEALSELFIWAQSPQGHNYWMEIDNKLRGE